MADQPKKKVTIVTKKKPAAAASAAQPPSEPTPTGAKAGAKKGAAKDKGGLLDLKRILDFPAGLAENAREVWMAGIGALSTVEETGAELFNQLVKKGEHWERESRQRLAAAQKGVSSAVEGAKQKAGDLAEMPGELTEKIEAQIQRVVEESVEGVLHRLNVPTHDEVQELIRRVDALAGKVDALQARLKEEKAGKAAPTAASDGPADGRATVRVVPREDGWAVEREGASRASSVHGTKAEAVSAGRELARSHEPSRLVVYKQDGTAQSTTEYGGEA